MNKTFTDLCTCHSCTDFLPPFWKHTMAVYVLISKMHKQKLTKSNVVEQTLDTKLIHARRVVFFPNFENRNLNSEFRLPSTWTEKCQSLQCNTNFSSCLLR